MTKYDHATRLKSGLLMRWTRALTQEKADTFISWFLDVDRESKKVKRDR